MCSAGCATVIRGTDETAEFESTPAGATVTATRITESDDSPVSCTTPCKMELSRKRDYNITFELEGHKPAIAKMSSVVTGGGGAGFLGNALLGGPIGAVVDAGTGAAQDLRPNPMFATLVPLDSEDQSVVRDKEGELAPPPEYRDENGDIIEAPMADEAPSEAAGADAEPFDDEAPEELVEDAEEIAGEN